VAEAIEMARALEPLFPFWLEDPYDINDLSGLISVKESVKTPIAVGETLNTYSEYLSYIKLGAADFIQTDVSVNGGLDMAKRIAALADGYGLPIATHVWGTAVSLAANLHFGICSRNLVYVEHPKVENPLVENLFVEKPKLADGQLEMPAIPGLGVELDDATINLYTPTAPRKKDGEE
jgi:L-alanine-DL-glutamate epimerase-like enolase superfamily enzyme